MATRTLDVAATFPALEASATLDRQARRELDVAATFPALQAAVSLEKLDYNRADVAATFPALQASASMSQVALRSDAYPEFCELDDYGLLGVRYTATGPAGHIVCAAEAARKLTWLYWRDWERLRVLNSISLSGRPLAIQSTAAHLFVLVEQTQTPDGVPVLQVYDNTTFAGTLLAELGLDRSVRPRALAASNDSTYLAVGGADGAVEIRTAGTALTLLTSIETGIRDPEFLAMSANGDGTWTVAVESDEREAGVELTFQPASARPLWISDRPEPGRAAVATDPTVLVEWGSVSFDSSLAHAERTIDPEQAPNYQYFEAFGGYTAGGGSLAATGESFFLQDAPAAFFFVVAGWPSAPLNVTWSTAFTGGGVRNTVGGSTSYAATWGGGSGSGTFDNGDSQLVELTAEAFDDAWYELNQLALSFTATADEGAATATVIAIPEFAQLEWTDPDPQPASSASGFFDGEGGKAFGETGLSGYAHTLQEADGDAPDGRAVWAFGDSTIPQLAGSFSAGGPFPDFPYRMTIVFDVERREDTIAGDIEVGVRWEFRNVAFYESASGTIDGVATDPTVTTKPDPDFPSNPEWVDVVLAASLAQPAPGGVTSARITMTVDAILLGGVNVQWRTYCDTAVNYFTPDVDGNYEAQVVAVSMEARAR